MTGKHPGATGLFAQSQKVSSGSDAKSQEPVAPNAPTATLCIAGTLAATDPSFDHPENTTASCNPTSSPSRRDHYVLTLGGCATTTTVTITTDGPAGCAHPAFGTTAQCAALTAGTNDTTISVYRKGGATAGTASGSGFSSDPADLCGTSTVPQRLVGFNDDISGANTLSSVTVILGPGDYDVVVSGFSDLNSCEGRGNYNLSFTTSGSTCTLTQQPTASDGLVRGRIVDSNGAPISGSVVNLSGTQSRKTITDSDGNYHFNAVETSGFYTVTPTRSNYAFSPGSRSFSQIGSSTESAFTGVSSGDTVNPLDTSEFFVRQQYLDVLNREPDEGGFNYWSDQILACAGDADCTRAARTGVASAFFVEQEFRQSGAFIYNLYKDALGRRPVYAEYSADRGQVVGGATLEAQKQAFAAAFVSRAEFAGRFESNTTAESFVDALLANAQQASGVDLGSQRDSLIESYNTGASQAASRTLVLRDVTEGAAVRDANYNAAFVLVEYFGYLHRGPDQEGYDFWLNVLNESGRNGDPGNYRGMVCSFITSREYQNRFSVVVSHSNGECGQ